MRSIATFVIAVALLAPACASAPGAGGSSGSELLTREQLAERAGQSVYDVVLRLRPQWLNSRGPGSVVDPTPQSPSVYFNGSIVGDAEFLRQLSVSDTEELRYWRPGRASARFGMGHVRGVIEVIARS